MVFNFSIFNWDSAGVITSSILSGLLIFFTIRIAKRQNKMQKDITRQQTKLQEGISDRDIKAQNYQHRVKCYLQIVEASTILTKAHAFNMSNIIQNKPIIQQEVNNLHYGQQLLLKTQLEAKLLFSQELAEIMYRLFDNYSEYFQQTVNFMLSPERVRAFAKGTDLVRVVSGPTYPEGFKQIKEDCPALASIMELENKIMTLFKSKEFNDLFLKETKVE